MSSTRSSQQDETLDYFRAGAEAWRKSAIGEAQGEVNVIAQRIEAVLRVARRMNPAPGLSLDVGCGTGQLSLALAAMGGEAVGLDFAPEMIEQCTIGLKKDPQPGVSFIQGSIFDYGPPAGRSLDLISALGFIEYVSPDELEQLLVRFRKWLRPGGFCVLGSRNRLFNLFSLNRFTQLERGLGTIEALLNESLLLAMAKDPTSALKAAMDAATPLPQPEVHPEAGVTVTQRYQYTPGELAALTGRFGFRAVSAAPVHYHPMPPAVKGDRGAFHLDYSEALFAAAPEDVRLVPQASTFVMALEAV
ncbi:MAG: methyltransferase domain-containing protein [Magnetococcales bacterium]|nr:methyltransferase domain-containing protein [Magnetococcales bacterium]